MLFQVFSPYPKPSSVFMNTGGVESDLVCPKKGPAGVPDLVCPKKGPAGLKNIF